ncbi:aminopeptidase P family protein [Neolewinella litorea]|uniref:Aminopeptidase P family protein n=1 Tax=Neolewinella litorea TaxID=2562452 RepID=A0A4S4NKP1_9BACT|nr:aminopeptidase P family protein [Neolewinella litorea]THH39387.1 aminopeptidase P family protein [Neolewinella litorea]
MKYIVGMTIPEKLTALRQQLLEYQLDAYIVPSTDPHQSEYPAPRWASREWLSGFTGSAGTMVVTLHEARLWTDSRYFLQAEQELAGSGIQLMKLKTPHTPEYAEWLTDHLLSGQTVGVDGRIFSAHAAQRLEKKLKKAGLHLRTDHDLIDFIWKDRPDLPNRPVSEHLADFSGERWEDRLDQLLAWMQEQDLDYYLVSALDELAWLLNLRGTDIDFNPLMVGYFIAGRRGDHAVFAEQTDALSGWADKLPGLQRLPYREASHFLRRLNAEDADIGFDPTTTSVFLARAAGGKDAANFPSPIPRWKAKKNPTALGHLREVMAHDAVALLRLRRWLDGAVGEGVTEYEVGEKLADFRAQYDNYVSESFNPIVGYGANGAIVHYHATAEDSATVKAEGILLVDSGGQYHNGTTDITRTFAVGTPTEAQRLHFTLVLQGHIDLAMARFPTGTSGVQLDVLARRPLWLHELNYGHGTGHGVGFFLNVHEGPAGISPNPLSPTAQHALEPGMVLSNEPGYYRDGEYGIRTENLVVVTESDREGWLYFETITLFPIDRRLIDTSLLTVAQLGWLNDYHRLVWEKVSPLLDGDELEWLRRECATL